MKLTAQHVANLNILADFMETLNAPEFTMTRYVNHSFPEPCGTPACALGWACTVPQLQARGLDFGRLRNHEIDAPHEMAKMAFGPCYTDMFRSSLAASIKTPKEWAEHCRAKLAEWGYAPTQDKFRAFMQKVLTKVQVEA